MRKTLLLFSVMISVILFSTAVFAGPWNVPTNVRIVQKSNTDTNGRIYGTIQAAINSIPTSGASAPSATNPYLVKVMPGVYDLGAGSIRMKPYITLEGSGRENTVITSVVPETGNFSCAVGTVIMANNSTIRNVTVKNSFVNPGFTDAQVTALAVKDVKATAVGVSLSVSSQNANRTAGICSYGINGHIVLQDSYIEANVIGGNQSMAISATFGSALTMTHSKLLATSTDGASTDVINCHEGQDSPGTAVIFDSQIESGGDGFAIIVEGETCHVTMVNSSIIASNTGGFISIEVGSGADGPYVSKYANNLIPGGTGSMQGAVFSAKLVNNYDENFNPIQNQ